MGPTAILLGAGALGIIALGIFLFPTMNTVVQDWMDNVFILGTYSPLEEFFIESLPYIGLALFLLGAYWLFMKKD